MAKEDKIQKIIDAAKEQPLHSSDDTDSATMGHIAAVIAAFVGGKIIPEDRDVTARDRVNDNKGDK